MKYRSIFSVLALIVVFSACKSGQNSATNSPAQAVQPAAQPAPAASPIVVATPASSSSPDQTGKKSGAQDNVPEIMKRPMTKEEMEKAMQALPPEVRARLQGMGVRPAGPAATPTPKK
jgi:hypothetical protein